MAQARLLVVAPTARELGGLRASADGRGLVTGITGLGRHSAEGLRRLMATYGPQAVLSLGFAGALDPRLRCSDLVACRRTVAQGIPEAAPADAHLMEAAEMVLRKWSIPYHQGDLLTAAEVLTHPEEKGRAYEETGAAVVDLEGYWLAQEARRAGVPFLPLRAVLDPQSQRLPGLVEEIVVARGQGELWRSMRYVTRHPWRAPQLGRLAWQAHSAAWALGIAGKRLSHAMTEEP